MPRSRGSSSWWRRAQGMRQRVRAPPLLGVGVASSPVQKRRRRDRSPDRRSQRTLLALLERAIVRNRSRTCDALLHRRRASDLWDLDRLGFGQPRRRSRHRTVAAFFRSTDPGSRTGTLSGHASLYDSRAAFLKERNQVPRPQARRWDFGSHTIWSQSRTPAPSFSANSFHPTGFRQRTQEPA